MRSYAPLAFRQIGNFSLASGGHRLISPPHLFVTPVPLISLRSISTSCSTTSSTPKTQTPQPPAGNRPPRFYVPDALTSPTALPGSTIRLSKEESHHAARTLRLKEGDALELCDGLGGVALAEISALDKAGAVVRVTTPPTMAERERWDWTVAVACGSLKGGRADWLVEKAVELGATRLQPLLTIRSPKISGSDRDERSASLSGGGGGGKEIRKKGRKNLGDGGEEEESGLSGREGRWHRVANAAMKQCLRPRAMQIAAPCSVEQLCQFAQDHQVVWVGTEGAPPLHTIAAETLEKLEKLEKNEATSGAVSLPHKGLLIIGPEGDFTVEELQMMATVGRAVVVGLGNNRLRSETAAISMLSFATLTLS